MRDAGGQEEEDEEEFFSHYWYKNGAPDNSGLFFDFIGTAVLLEGILA